MRSIMIMLFIILVICQGQVFADGNNLLKSCELALYPNQTSTGDLENLFDAGFCFGFIQGVYQLNGLYQTKLNHNKPYFCLPNDGISNGQAIRIVIKFLKEHPEKLHLEEIALVALAFIEAFPCRK